MRRNRPSRSAVKVAQAVAFLDGDPAISPLLPAGLAPLNERLLLTVGRLKPRHLRAMRRPWLRRFFLFVDSLGEPGQLLHVGIRKRLVDDEARAALAGGCRQVLVIGGGLDTLSLRLARDYPDRLFLELDHPASQQLKREALAGLMDGDGELPLNLRLLAVDLTSTSLGAALATVGEWDRSAPMFALAEGVLMYIDVEHVAALLRQLHDACGAGSRLLFSTIRSGADGRMLLGKRPRLAAAYLAVGGEPLRWTPRAEELAPLLASAGWRLVEERFDLRQRYLVPAGLAERPLGGVEIYSLAERA